MQMSVSSTAMTFTNPLFCISIIYFLFFAILCGPEPIPRGLSRISQGLSPVLMSPGPLHMSLSPVLINLCPVHRTSAMSFQSLSPVCREPLARVPGSFLHAGALLRRPCIPPPGTWSRTSQGTTREPCRGNKTCKYTFFSCLRGFFHYIIYF